MSERNLYEVELEKVTQFWTITRKKLAAEKEQNIKMESKIQLLKTAHVEQISVSFFY